MCATCFAFMLRYDVTRTCHAIKFLISIWSCRANWNGDLRSHFRGLPRLACKKYTRSLVKNGSVLDFKNTILHDGT